MTRPALNASRGPAFGTVQPVFDDVFWAWGTTQFRTGFFPLATFPRNMVVMREADGLVVVHPVLLPEAEQAKLDALGPVKHIVRLGDFHGTDDALYVERYKPKVWAPPHAMPRAGVTVDEVLVPGGPLPVSDGTLVRFGTAKAPETVLHLSRHGGLLATCDSVQNWGSRPEGCSFIGSLLARAMGFRGQTCIGPGWRKACEPKDGAGFGPDFRSLLALDWAHLLPAHGPPVLHEAKKSLRSAVDALYPPT